MIAYLIPIAVLWVAIVAIAIAMFQVAAEADRQAERLHREPRSVADGVDWKVLTAEGIRRHRERRREVIR